MKSTKSRILAMLLSLCLVFTLLPMAALAADYEDTDGHWAEAEIDRWTEAGVVKGESEGEFDPDGNMTRGQAAQVFVNLLKLKEEADVSAFADMTKGAWYVSPIAKAVKAGILNGTGATTMDPDGTLSREMMFVMVGRALGIEPETTSDKTFADGNQTDSWAAGYINALVNMGVINGVDSTHIAPLADINRASVMKVLDNLIGGYANEEGQTVEIVEGKITLIVADDVTVTGTADPDLPIVVTGEAGSVDMKGVTGEATVQVQASDVAIKNAPVGTTVEAAEDAADVTVNGTTVPEDGEVTVKPAPTPTPTPQPTPEPEKQPADYTVIFDATYGTITVNEDKGNLDDTCYGGENEQLANAKWISIKFNQVTELKLVTFFTTALPFSVTGPKGNGFAENGATLAGWFEPDTTTAVATTNADLLNVDLVTLDADGDHQIVLSAYWNKADGTDGGVCYGGENDDNGTYTDSKNHPSAPTEVEYTIIFDATDWGTIDLKENTQYLDDTCWGGENTCWGGDNNAQENHKWVIFKVKATDSDTLDSKGINPDNFFTLKPVTEHNTYKHIGWGYVTEGLEGQLAPTSIDPATTTIKGMANNGKVILVAGWKVNDGDQATCYGGANDKTGSYDGANNTSKLPTSPEP